LSFSETAIEEMSKRKAQDDYETQGQEKKAMVKSEFRIFGQVCPN
jgi:hypothetical protein